MHNMQMIATAVYAIVFTVSAGSGTPRDWSSDEGVSFFSMRRPPEKVLVFLSFVAPPGEAPHLTDARRKTIIENAKSVIENLADTDQVAIVVHGSGLRTWTNSQVQRTADARTSALSYLNASVTNPLSAPFQIDVALPQAVRQHRYPTLVFITSGYEYTQSGNISTHARMTGQEAVRLLKEARDSALSPRGFKFKVVCIAVQPDEPGELFCRTVAEAFDGQYRRVDTETDRPKSDRGANALMRQTAIEKEQNESANKASEDIDASTSNPQR